MSARSSTIRGGLWLLALVACLAGPAAWAQEPWDGWYGPPAEGLGGVRFGMDRESMGRAAQAAGLSQLEARRGTMRFGGKILGRSAELLAEFHEDELGERLSHLQIRWGSLQGGAGAAVRFFEDIEARLAAEHGPSLVEKNSSAGQLSTGRGAYLRLYRDVELQAVLELKAPRPDLYNLTLLMDYPPLQPKLSGS